MTAVATAERTYWCRVGSHGSCVVSIRRGLRTVKCSCECHSPTPDVSPEPPPPTSADAISAPVLSPDVSTVAGAVRPGRRVGWDGRRGSRADEQGTLLAKRRPNGAVPRLGYPTKEEAACCLALVDDLGRPPIGWCGPDCERRPR